MSRAIAPWEFRLPWEFKAQYSKTENNKHNRNDECGETGKGHSWES